MVLRNLVNDRDPKQILTHKRVAPDGIAYTKQEFEDFYGESQGHYRWSQADVAPDDLADVATSSSMARAAISPQPKPPPPENMLFQAPATEHAIHAPLATIPENPSHAASDSSMSSAEAPALPKSPPPPVASNSSMSSAAEPTLPKRPPPPVARSSSPPPVASSSSPPPVASSSSRSRAAESTSRPDAEPQRCYPQPLPDEIRRLPTVDLPPVDVTQPVVAPVHVDAGSSANHQVGEQPLRLMPEDVRAIQRAERDRGPPRSLHQLARNALNDIEDRDPPIDVSLDNEFPWREYIAAHNESAKIIGTGIVQARAVFFKDQKDPNRGGASRVDFCFVRSDDTVCRVHPGLKRSGDAKLRFAPRSQFFL